MARRAPLLSRADWRQLVVGVAILTSPASAFAQPIPEICVLRHGWVAPIAPQDVAAALAIRETARRVSVCDTPAKIGGGCDVVLSTSPGGVMTVLVTCGQGPTVMDEVPAGAASDVARRVAVEASLLLVTAKAGAQRGDQSPESAAAAAAKQSPAPVAVTDSPSAASVTNRFITLRLAGGETYAQELSDGTYAILIDARWFALRHAFLTLGLKLAGPFQQSFAGEVDTASDRALWLGGGYRLDFTKLFLDLSVAVAYTVPVLESRDDPERDFREESSLSRVGLRGGLLGGWKFHPNAAAVVELAAIASLEEREIETDGRDSLELGTMVLDLTLGLEVQF